MAKTQLLQEVETELKNFPHKFKVTTDKNYHGIRVDVYAENKELGKTFFMYVLDSREPEPLDVINLYTLRRGNNEILKKHNCEYFLLSKGEPGETVKDLSEANNIPIFRNISQFKNAISKYSKN